MQKWRTYYPLMQSKKLKEDETGITLVELLAAISILSIVILLAGSVHMFGQKQFIEQTKSASQENDISLAMTVMTKDLRKLEWIDVEVKEKNKETADSEILVKGEPFYTGENNELRKEGTLLLEEVRVNFESVGNKDGIHIEIENIHESGPQKKYETTIYFRR